MENLIKLINGEDAEPATDDDTAMTLASEVEQYLMQKEVMTGTKTITAFAPSYGYTCKRRWVLLFQGAEYEKTFTPRLLRIFGNGHGVHDRWQEYLQNMGILEQAEVPMSVSEPIPMRGYADGIINWGGRKLIEIKSINTQRFEWRRTYKRPDEKTYAQAQCYLFMSGLDAGYVIYENKDTQDVLIFPIYKDQKLIDKELRRYVKIYQMYEEGKTPARPYKRDSRQCGECDLIKYCWDVLDD